MILIIRRFYLWCQIRATIKNGRIIATQHRNPRILVLKITYKNTFAISNDAVKFTLWLKMADLEVMMVKFINICRYLRNRKRKSETEQVFYPCRVTACKVTNFEIFDFDFQVNRAIFLPLQDYFMQNNKFGVLDFLDHMTLKG